MRAVVLLLLWTPVVSAQSLSWKLEVDSPLSARCISAERLAAAVEARSRPPARPQDVAAMLVRVHVLGRTTPLGFNVSVTDSDASGIVRGRRELSIDGDCAELEGALALVIAAMVGTEQPHESARAQPPSEPVPVRPSQLPSRAASEPSLPWSFDTMLGIRGVSGVMEGLAPGVSVRGSANWSDVQLQAGALWLPAAGVAAGAQGQTILTAVLGELGICGVTARIGRGGFAFCAALQAGSMWDRTTGLWRTRTNQRLLVLVTPSAQLALPLTRRLLLRAALGASVPCTALRYTYQDADGDLHVHHSVDMGLWSELSVGVRLGG